MRNASPRIASLFPFSSVLGRKGWVNLYYYAFSNVVNPIALIGIFNLSSSFLDFLMYLHREKMRNASPRIASLFSFCSVLGQGWVNLYYYAFSNVLNSIA